MLTQVPAPDNGAPIILSRQTLQQQQQLRKVQQTTKQHTVQLQPDTGKTTDHTAEAKAPQQPSHQSASSKPKRPSRRERLEQNVTSCWEDVNIGRLPYNAVLIKVMDTCSSFTEFASGMAKVWRGRTRAALRQSEYYTSPRHF